MKRGRDPYGHDVIDDNRHPPLGQSRAEAMNVRCFNPQFFVASRVGDVALDQELELRASGFERQFGVVVDALRVLSAAVPTNGLLPADRLALDRLQALAAWKNSSDGPDGSADISLSTAEVDDLIRKLQQLRQTDPEGADDVIRRVVREAGAPASTTVA
jgi:hypothetical protein